MDTGSGSDPRKYVRLAAVLRARITTGQFALGEKLPTVAVLAEEQQVSRQTVTKALHLLVHEGLLAPVLGLGFYVRTRPSAPPVASSIVE
jgi:DNA-binding GntR family transcriptional regulator